MFEEMQETIDQMDTEITELKEFKDAMRDQLKHVKDKFQSKATEFTIAHYFDEIANSLHRELGSSAPHDASKLNKDPKLE